MKMTDEQSKLYHSHTFKNMEEVERSQKCGCIACCTIFNADQIEECIGEADDEKMTALCPYCGIDAVIGDACGMEINQEILKDLNKRWF